MQEENVERKEGWIKKTTTFDELLLVLSTVKERKKGGRIEYSKERILYFLLSKEAKNMKKNNSAKEELVNMLSEIYQQLEELENALDSSFSGIRKQWHDENTDQLSACKERIDRLESEAILHNAAGKAADRDGFQRQGSMKLELGYKLH